MTNEVRLCPRISILNRTGEKPSLMKTWPTIDYQTITLFRLFQPAITHSISSFPAIHLYTRRFSSSTKWHPITGSCEDGTRIKSVKCWAWKTFSRWTTVSTTLTVMWLDPIKSITREYRSPSQSASFSSSTKRLSKSVSTAMAKEELAFTMRSSWLGPDNTTSLSTDLLIVYRSSAQEDSSMSSPES